MHVRASCRVSVGHSRGPTSSLALLCVMIAGIAVLARAQAGDTLHMPANWALYSFAQVQCSMQYKTQPSLAQYSSPQDKQQIQALCLNISCWVDGEVLTGEDNVPLCPYVYVPPDNPASAKIEHTLCSSYQRFVCREGPTLSRPPPRPRSPPPPSPPRPPSPSPPKPAPPPPKPPSPAPPPPPTPRPPPPPLPPSPRQQSPSPPQPLRKSPPTSETSSEAEAQNPPSSSPKSTSPSPARPLPPPSPAAASSPSPNPPTEATELPQPVSNAAYDQSTYELLPELSNVVAVHLVHIPGTNEFLYMERPSGYHPDRSRNIAGSFDIVTREWTHLDTPDGLFCCGHTQMANGSIAIVGGHQANAGYPSGLLSVRTYTAGTPALIKATSMLYPRWYPTATLLPDGQIMIMGGTQAVGAGTAVNPFYEIWNPEVPTVTRQLQVEPTYLSRVRQNYYPFNYIMPSGDMFNWCNRDGWILNPYTGEYKVAMPRRPLSVVSPRTGYSTQFPFTGTSVMLALLPEQDYLFEVVQFGGQDVQAVYNLSIPACSESIRITVHPPNATSPTYDFGSGWVTEYMGSPRVMPDSVILPNGLVILLNGATTGLAGDSASGGDTRANYPNFFAELYDPYAPLGQRWSSLNRSQIARMYHSVAALTLDGTILVAGCDRCQRFTSDLPFSMPRVKAEYRNEIFYPPFYYDFAGKPRILDAPSTIRFNQRFTVSYTGEQDPNVQVTSAVLVAPSSVTHSFNTNQRVIKLVMSADPGSGTLTLTGPPSPNHAPPQMYMLFLLNGKTYSKARWIMLTN